MQKGSRSQIVAAGRQASTKAKALTTGDTEAQRGTERDTGNA